MEKKLYLIRHAKPTFPYPGKMCLGQFTDPGLSEEGRESVRVLAPDLKEILAKAGRIYTSPLKRAQETAQILSACSGTAVPLMIRETLKELDFGPWDGLLFSEIRERYPKLYAERERDMSLLPEGCESYEAAGLRAAAALHGILSDSNSDTVVAVAHSALNRAFLCRITGIPYAENRRFVQAYAGVSVLNYHEKAGFTLLSEA